MPVTAVPFAVNVQVVLLSELMSVEPGDAIAVRQNGIPPLADTACDEGVTVIEVTGFVTLMVPEPLTVTLVAEIVASPTPTPFTSPAVVTLAMV